jgi:hypothetical protein
MLQAISTLGKQRFALLTSLVDRASSKDWIFEDSEELK